MTALQYNDISARRVDGRTKKLCIRIYDCGSNQLLGVMEPMSLLWPEYDLCGGRFRAYDPSVRDHEVTIPALKSNAFYQGFIHMVEWIADAAHGSWSFFVTAKDKWNCVITFYFDDPQDAMLFRLSIN